MIVGSWPSILRVGIRREVRGSQPSGITFSQEAYSWVLLHHEAVRCHAEPTTYANSKRAKRRISMRS